MPTFDPLVFDASVFDASYATPLLERVSIHPEYSRVTQGQSVPFRIHLQSVTTTFDKRYDLNTASTPQVELTNPDGTVKQAFIDMLSQGLGWYLYVHNVGVSYQKGSYTVRFKAVNGDKTLLTPKMHLFQVV